MSRYMWIQLLSSKDHASVAIKNFQASVEAQAGRKLKTLRTDRGGEFTSVEFGRYSPQQNGVVERCNQSVINMARCMLQSKALPGYFWGEAVATAIHILNRAPTRALDDKTPYEAWHGAVPTVHYMRTFGCITHVKITRPGLKKLDDRSTKTIFVGYEPGCKAYRCYDPINERIIVSRDIVFDEGTHWCWDSTDGEPAIDVEPFTMEYTTEAIHDPASPSPSPTPRSPSPPEVPPKDFKSSD
jgi:hypothetical protein